MTKRFSVLNTTTATTDHMAGIMRALAPLGISVKSCTIKNAPAIVTDEGALAAFAQQITQGGAAEPQAFLAAL
jgi:hypothetical protein